MKFSVLTCQEGLGLFTGKSWLPSLNAVVGVEIRWCGDFLLDLDMSSFSRDRASLGFRIAFYLICSPAF